MSDKLSIDKNSISVHDLLDYLQNSVPKDKPAFDIRNILVAVNGADSSALQGNETLIKDGDIVSIIPVIHGGSRFRAIFKISNYIVELIRIEKVGADPIQLLESLRAKFPNLIIQGIRAKYILGTNHAKRIIGISLAAAKAGTLLSNKIETDILMRFAQSRQISDAISKVGLKNDEGSILIVVGQKYLIDNLVSDIHNIIKPITPFPNNANFIKKEFTITKKELGCILSKEPLEDILVERSAVLLN
ncbi:MAG: MoaD/ThiS family protein [Thaumarchaeota archaeon]|nr:MoaD/ThiS family protein [Nitrososphaerota archaeon]